MRPCSLSLKPMSSEVARSRGISTTIEAAWGVLMPSQGSGILPVRLVAGADCMSDPCGRSPCSHMLSFPVLLMWGRQFVLMQSGAVATLLLLSCPSGCVSLCLRACGCGGRVTLDLPASSWVGQQVMAEYVGAWPE